MNKTLGANILKSIIKKFEIKRLLEMLLDTDSIKIKRPGHNIRM